MSVHLVNMTRKNEHNGTCNQRNNICECTNKNERKCTHISFSLVVSKCWWSFLSDCGKKIGYFHWIQHKFHSTKHLFIVINTKILTKNTLHSTCRHTKKKHLSFWYSNCPLCFYTNLHWLQIEAVFCLNDRSAMAWSLC